MEEAFKHFDKDGCGSITAQGFSAGLREMGVFEEFSGEEMDEVGIPHTARRCWATRRSHQKKSQEHHSVLLAINGIY